MNRRFISLLGVAGLVGLIAVAAVMTLRQPGVDLPTGLNLALQTVSAMAAIVGIPLMIHLARHEGATGVADGAGTPPPKRLSRPRPEEVRPEAESLQIYERQMREHLAAVGADPMKFVKLSTAAEPVSDEAEEALLPRLSWSRRYDSLQAPQPEDIDLFAIHGRFKRAVLLGEPGSGKSTCLQRLAVAALDDLESRGPDDPELLLPLYVPLSEWESSALSATDFLEQKLADIVGSANHYAYHFETLLTEGRFLLLLDGLNELPGRRSNKREGGSERPAGEGELGALTPALGVATDPRERMLRDLAKGTGVTSKFVLSCRGHEYFDSLQWQIVRILPMGPHQIEAFIGVYLAPEAATGLIEQMRASEELRGIATNPFFLRSLTRIYSPDWKVVPSRGGILRFLYRELLEREGREVVDPELEARITRRFGRLAFRMLKRGSIGNRVAISGLDDAERALVDVLAGTGLLVKRDGDVYFYHQIVQEFFAAQALSTGDVRADAKRLLASKRWSEVVALWLDLDPVRVRQELLHGLRARNLPWRRPWSLPNASLICYGLITSGLAAVTVLATFFSYVLWPLATLDSPVDGLVLSPLAIAVIACLLRYPWRCVVPHRAVISNSAYVLSIRQTHEALPEMVAAFRRTFRRETLEIAQSLGRYGDTAVPHAVGGLTSSSWRVRVGSVFTLGEIARQHDPTSPAVVEPLLAVTKAGDPQLAPPLMTALRHCRDPRVPDGVAEVIAGLSGDNPWKPMLLVQSLNEWCQEPQAHFGEQLTPRLFELAERPNRPMIRILALRTIGALRLPDSLEPLKAVAENGQEEPAVSAAAVTALASLQTNEAVDALVDLVGGSSSPDTYYRLYGAPEEVVQAACDGIRRLRDPGVLPAVKRAAKSENRAVRRATVIALGRLRTVEVLPVLIELAGDRDEDIRAMSAHALGAAGISGGVNTLERLARDPEAKVRAAALASLVDNFPELATPALVSLALDASSPERLPAIRQLGRHLAAEVDGTLEQLAGDTDRDVREAARTELARRHVRRMRQTSRVRAWLRRPLRSCKAFISRELKIPEIKAMMLEEQLSGTPDKEILSRIQSKMVTDAELARRFRKAMNVVYVVFWAAASLIGLIGMGLVWLLASLGAVLVGAWPLAAVLIGLCALTYLPGIRNLRWQSSTRRIVLLFRVPGELALLCLLIAAVVLLWWPLLLVAGAIGAVLWFREARRRRGRSPVLAAALVVEPTLAAA